MQNSIQLKQISTTHYQKNGKLNTHTVNIYVASTNTTTLEQLKNTSFYVKNYQGLIHQMKGFPKTWHNVSPVQQSFWEYNIACDTCDNIASIYDSLVILTPLQKKILYTLHLVPKELQI